MVEKKSRGDTRPADIRMQELLDKVYAIQKTEQAKQFGDAPELREVNTELALEEKIQRDILRYIKDGEAKAQEFLAKAEKWRDRYDYGINNQADNLSTLARLRAERQVIIDQLVENLPQNQKLQTM